MRRILIVAMFATAGYAQRPATPPRTGQAAAPFDLTGYWVSQIVDEWRFRVTPQKGDIAYLPINADARKIALAWDPDKDLAEGTQCKAYGAVGVMQRPGRLHVSWKDENTLQMDADAGTQTRLLHFDQTAPAGEPSWQGYSAAQWQVQGTRSDRSRRHRLRAGWWRTCARARTRRIAQSGDHENAARIHS